MRHSLPTCLLVAGLSAVPLDAQSSQPPHYHTARSWYPAQHEVARLVPCDLDFDDRDDVLMLKSNGKVVRAANPGLNTSFTLVPELQGTTDMVAVRRPGTIDLVVTVSSTAGLSVHGMRPEGNFLTLASNPALWQDVTELRVFDFNGAVLAGRVGTSNTIRTARLNHSTYAFSPLAVATFADDIFDFALSKRAQDAEVHVMAATDAGLERRHVDGTLISWMQGSSVEGHVVQLPESSFCAWVYKGAADANWQLSLERDGLAGPPVVLDYQDTDLEGLELDGLASADFNDDGFADLVLGQAPDGTFGVMYGSSTGFATANTAMIHTKAVVGVPQQPGQEHPPTVVGHPDGSRAGIFHVAGAHPFLDVLNGAPPVIAPTNPRDGLDDWVPHVGHVVPPGSERLADYHVDTSDLDLRIFFPPEFLDATRSSGHTHMQIEMWRVDDLADVNQGTLTLSQSSIYPVMQENLVWDLRLESTDVASDHLVKIPLDFGTTGPTVWGGTHVLMLLRVGKLEGSDPQTVTGSLFTTPIWVAMNEFEQPIFNGVSPFLDGSVTDPFFDPVIGSVPINQIDPPNSAGPKDIARVRTGLPVLPPLPEAPTPATVQNLGPTGG